MFIGWLPLILFGLGVFLGVKQSKRKGEQDQEGASIKVGHL